MLNSATAKVTCPEGTVFVRVVFDEEGRPLHVYAFCGKSGSALSALADALSRTISLLLQHGVDMEELMHVLGDITHDRSSPYTQAPSLASAIVVGLELVGADWFRRGERLEERPADSGSTPDASMEVV